MSKSNIIIYTTRLFDKEGYLFNSGECETIVITDGSCLGKFHLNNINGKDVCKLLIQDYNDLGDPKKIKDDRKRKELINKKISFLRERRVSVDSKHHANIDLLIDKLSISKSNEIDISGEDCILYDGTNNPYKFIEIIDKLCALNKIPIGLNLRSKIYKRNEKNIFGYRCLDIYDDIVDGSKDFVTSLVKDIAAFLLRKTCDAEQLLEDFFAKYDVDFVLHEEDINYPKGFNKKLTEVEVNDYLLKKNNELIPFINNIEAYIFQHTSNIFVSNLINFDKRMNANQLSNLFKNHTIYRSELEVNESDVFLGSNPHNSILNMKKIISKFEENRNNIY